MFSAKEIVEIIINPRAGLQTTNNYVGEPAEVVSIINKHTLLLEFCDGRKLTVDAKCVRKI